MNLKNYILEYVSSGRGKIIKATDDTIRQIVKDELDRLGHDADLNHIDVSRVTNMDSLFSCYDDDLGPKYKDLNPDISRWNVSNVKCMKSMFWECKNFDCDISDWDVSSVTDVAFMFHGCKIFDQDLSKWDVGNVEHHYFMFEDCPIKKEYKPKFK